MRKIVINRQAGIAYGVAAAIFLIAFGLILGRLAVPAGCVLEMAAFVITFRVAAINGHVD